MTLPPEKVGDKEQRYIVERTTKDVPEIWAPLGYSNDRVTANRIQLAASMMPGTRLTRTRDREAKP